MSDDSSDDGMMTLTFPPGTKLVRFGSDVRVMFPTEADAFVFVELLKSLDAENET